MSIPTSQPTVLVLAGTRDGLVLVTSAEDRATWNAPTRTLEGFDVYHAAYDPRDGSIWAAGNREDRGQVYRSTDLGVTWQPCGGPLPGDSVWHIEPGRASEPGRAWAGTRPANLFRTDDYGATWKPVDALNNHESREAWMEGGGGMNLHTIILPTDKPSRIYAGISAAGLFRSDDDGATWVTVNDGVASFAPDDPENPVKWPGVYRCVHKVVAHPLDGDLLFQQNHLGAYRSDDGGHQRADMNEGLPTRFGFPVAIGGAAPSPIFVIPEEMETIRTRRDLEVWRSLDGGATWSGSSKGLPSGEHNVLREGMACDALSPTGVYLGNKAGSLFASTDAGETFMEIAAGLPGVRSVSVGHLA